MLRRAAHGAHHGEGSGLMTMPADVSQDRILRPLSWKCAPLEKACAATPSAPGHKALISHTVHLAGDRSY